MAKNTRDRFKDIVRWIFGNSAWDIFKKIFSILWSVFTTWKLYLQPNLSRWLAIMDISVITAIIIMFFGVLFITLIVLSVVFQVAQSLDIIIKRHFPKYPIREPSRITKRKVNEWGGLEITQHEFPSDSHFGLGLRLKNNTGRKINLIKAELVYLLNSETKSIISINHGDSYLPWAYDNKSRLYDPQTMDKDETKTLIILNWKKDENRAWFPTEPIEPDKRSREMAIIAPGMEKQKFLIKDNRTYLNSGKRFYFEIEFRAKGKKAFIYKGNLVIDEKGNIKYA